mgnify:FL=1
MFKKLKIGAIIMARNNSSRLNGKIFKKIGNLDMLTHCVRNTKKISYLDEIIVATTSKIEDKKIAKITKKNNIKIFYGSENNVMKRYYDAATKYNLDIILRVTGDCPFLSSDVMDYMLSEHFKKNVDFSVPQKATIGTAGEIVNYSALRKVYNKIKNKKKLATYSEYFKFFFRNQKFKLKFHETILPKKYITNFRLTVDYASDLNMLNRLFKKLKFKKKEINIHNIIELLKKKSDLVKINNVNPVIYRKKSFINNLNKLINEN